MGMICMCLPCEVVSTLGSGPASTWLMVLGQSYWGNSLRTPSKCCWALSAVTVKLSGVMMVDMDAMVGWGDQLY